MSESSSSEQMLQHPAIVFVKESFQEVDTFKIGSHGGGEEQPFWDFSVDEVPCRALFIRNQYLFVVSEMCGLPAPGEKSAQLFEYLLQEDHHPYRFEFQGARLYMSLRLDSSDFLGGSREHFSHSVREFPSKAHVLKKELLEKFSCEP